MIESKTSFSTYKVAGQSRISRERLPAGPALLAVLGLSLAGWALVLAPLVAILHH